jgi:predicted acylesterase/phospholipase RssA
VVEQRHKLVLVAVSGGASRSAYWTAVVLDRLEKTLPGFGRRVRIISGASGGTLGTACYVT